MGKRPTADGEQPAITEILNRLNGSDPGAAWAGFIDRYAPLIMRAVRQFEFEHERADDCFLHICEKLCEHDFRRLLQFDASGPASFRTWLGSVVYRLCVDWHRKEFGRATLLPAISAMPAFDQAVYRLHFERGVDREDCRRSLLVEFPGLTREQLGDAIARIHRALSPRQRWRLSLAGRGRRATGTTAGAVQHLPDPGLEPESEAGRAERRRLVQHALAELADRQRLLLQLRYEQGLTLRKIAGVLGLSDPYRARREIEAALDALSSALPLADLDNS